MEGFSQFRSCGGKIKVRDRDQTGLKNTGVLIAEDKESWGKVGGGVGKKPPEGKECFWLTRASNSANFRRRIHELSRGKKMYVIGRNGNQVDWFGS